MKKRKEKRSYFSKIKKYFNHFGPGIVTGAADDDPSGIATYTQAGAQFGKAHLWTSVYITPFMSAIQEMCGRIGLVTGKGLAGVIKKYYSKKILYFCVFLLIMANIINIGTDLGAMAAAAELVFGIDFIYLILIMTAITLLLEIFVSYKIYSKYLKYLALSLVSYIIVAFIIKQSWKEIAFSALIPKFTFAKENIMNLVAIFGTTISPYLFFWQASQEVEEEVENKKIKGFNDGKPKINRFDIKALRIDTIAGMLFSNLVMFFIILTAASTLGAHGITDIQTADQAAQVLRPLAGDFVYLLFALGIIGVGLLAVPILAGSASYALSETFNLKEGLYKKFRQAHGFYGIITIAAIVGLIINFTSIPPFKMLYYAAIINGIVAPPLMIMILLISNNKKIMGNYSNGKLANSLGWIITFIMGISAIALLLSL